MWSATHPQHWTAQSGEACLAQLAVEGTLGILLHAQNELAPHELAPSKLKKHLRLCDLRQVRVARPLVKNAVERHHHHQLCDCRGACTCQPRRASLHNKSIPCFYPPKLPGYPLLIAGPATRFTYHRCKSGNNYEAALLTYTFQTNRATLSVRCRPSLVTTSSPWEFLATL